MHDCPSPAHEALIRFLYQAPIGLLQTTLSGEITMINPMSAQLLMPLVKGGALVNLFDVLAPVAPELRAMAAPASAPGSVICDALRVTMPSAAGAAARGGQAPRTLSIRLLRLDDTSLMASVSDVTLAVQQEQQRLTVQLHDASRVDRLTLLPNRMVAAEHIERALERASIDPHYQFAVLFINVDRFDRINLRLGKEAGDQLLGQIAGRISATLRDTDTVTSARLGGDEFVVVLELARGIEDAFVVAQRLTDVLCKPGYSVGELPVHLGLSMGVLTRAHANGGADSVLQDANLAMREAKRAGGARFCLFEPGMKQRATLRGTLEDELRVALTQGQLFVVYQPIVDLKAGCAVGVEALVRWRHPRRGIVPPVQFIPVAEETGLIGPLGEFVLNVACRQMVAWQALLGDHAPRMMSVNLSRAQLMEPFIDAKVRSALEASGLAADCLQLEVTESLAAQDEQIQARLQELKALGLVLALDDFGTGYSSLASLHQLPIDVVKIDRSFVSKVATSAHHRVLIEAVVRVARSLGMRTVAEGVETEQQAAVLKELECEKAQGYLYARPMDEEEATRWLVDWIQCADSRAIDEPNAASLRPVRSGGSATG
ncbi:MAG: bifunctional diguanylate cyclase/phosphodiesterase [Burkholderiales bacterium]